MDHLLLVERITVCATGLVAGAVYFYTAVRVKGCGEASAPARFAVCAVAVVVAALVAIGTLDPVVGYSLTCLSLVVVHIADLLLFERTRRRRVALLTPRPTADSVPAIWVAITLVCTLVLIPYLLGGIEVVAALISAACALTMSGIAWRVATAPTQLTGTDPGEHGRDRAERARQVGLTCVVAVGSLALFVAFVNASPPVFGGLGRITAIQVLALWATLWIWQSWYVRRLSNTARTLAD